MPATDSSTKDFHPKACLFRGWRRDCAGLVAALLIAYIVGLAAQASNAGASRGASPGASQATSPGPSVQAIKLRQIHTYLGDTETIVSSAGVRIKNLSRMRFTLVATPPNWKVTIFRDDDKSYYETTLKELDYAGLWSEVVTKMYPNDWGMPWKPQQFEFCGYQASRVTNGDRLLEYIPRPKGVPTQVCHILHGAFKVPTNNQITIHFRKTKQGKSWRTGRDETGERNNVIMTTKAENVKVPLSTFVPPSGYKQVKGIPEIMTSNANRQCDDLGDILKMGEGKGINNLGRASR